MNERDIQKKKISERIKDVRNQLGLTMKEFGKKFDPPASDSIVSRWERGINLPNEERLKRIAELGDISTFYLTTGEKSLSDLTDEELSKAAQGVKDSLGRMKKEQRENIEKEFERLLKSDMNIVETTYFINVLNYLKYSSKEDIIALGALIRNLNVYNEAGHADDITQEELLEFIEGETKYFKEFLKQRFHYKGDE